MKLQGLRILILNDEPYWQEVVVRSLKNAGAVVEVATQIDEAIENLYADDINERPHLMISDVRMGSYSSLLPSMQAIDDSEVGYYFIKHIRQGFTHECRAFPCLDVHNLAIGLNTGMDPSADTLADLGVYVRFDGVRNLIEKIVPVYDFFVNGNRDAYELLLPKRTKEYRPELSPTEIALRNQYGHHKGD